MRELQRQIGLVGMAHFLEDADDELHEDVKNSASEATPLPKSFSQHSDIFNRR